MNELFSVEIHFVSWYWFKPIVLQFSCILININAKGAKNGTMIDLKAPELDDGTMLLLTAAKLKTGKILDLSDNKNLTSGKLLHMKTTSAVTANPILIELEDEGWRFSCNNFNIDIDNGLYFGNKNFYKENQNIFISGISDKLEEIIKWEICKLQ